MCNRYSNRVRGAPVPNTHVVGLGGGDHGETTTKEAPKTERPTEDTESEDSLPELVSEDTEASADNTLPSTEEEDTNTGDKEKEKKKQVMYKELDGIDKEARMQELTVDFILNLEDENYKPPTPCIGLTCPLTGEQYFID